MLRRFALGIVLLVGFSQAILPQGLSPATPAQEYIRLNGQIIAIETTTGPAGSTSPFGAIDIPGAANNNQPLSGNAVLSGWALSNTSAISQVVINIDGQVMGNATYGASRSDVCQNYPNAVGCPGGNVGWTYSLNTVALTNGAHTLTVALADSGTPALTSSLNTSFTVSNLAPPPGAPQADDFNGSSVNTSLWTKQDAVGDATVSESGGELHISVPGGTAHDPYTSGNNGVEVMQSITDSDFQVEAKFDSTPTNPYSSQGLMAQQDTADYVRCDIAWIASGLNTYSALLQGTTVSHAATSALTASSSYWLRLARQGSQWTCSVSTNGTTYTQVNQFAQTLTITKVGVWAGNAAPAGQTPPAFTALIDYFGPVATLGAPQADQFNDSSANTSLWTKQDAVGDATVSESGGHLQIAVPSGTKHDPYTSGNTGVEMMQAIADADFQVEAKFDSSPLNPYSSQGLMAQQDTSNYVRCDVAWTSGLGTYSALLQGTTVSHAATSTLAASSSYWLRLARQGSQWTCSVSTNGTTYTQVNQFAQTLTITKVGVWAGNAAPSGQTPPAYTALIDYFTPVTTTTIYQPDEFNSSSVNTSLWTKQDAIGDGTLSESGGELHISVPAGVKHDPYTSGNTGIEVLQSVANGDFQVEAKFDSALPATGEQGLMAMQDVSTYVRCDLIGDGTYVNTYSAFLSGTSVSHDIYTRYSIVSSYWLRLSRQGNTWTCSVSTDGTTFSQVNQFTQSMTLTKIGPWAGNQSTAFTALVDYFH